MIRAEYLLPSSAADMSRDLLPALSPQKNYQPEKWTARHRKCVALEMAGLKNKEIAEIMGWSESKVSVTLNDDRAAVDRNELAGDIQEKVQDVHLRLQMISNEALDEVIDEMRHSSDENVRQRAAFSILDRAGYGKVNKHVVARSPVSDEVVDRLEETLEEIEELEEGVDYEVLDPEFEESGREEAIPMGDRVS